jgi:uncharacterized membrane protein YeiH
MFASLSAVQLLDLAGIVVFAASGALVASRKQMDIFGFALLGTVTGVGGGTIRDLLLGRTVFWVADPTSVVVCIAVSTLVFFTAHIPESRYRLLLWLDALGLAAVCVRGTQIALDSGTGPIVAVVMGVITAAFGGMVRDVLGGESPLVLRREIYVTAALLGAASYVAAQYVVPVMAASMIGFAAAFALRALALHFNWSLPTYRPRRARSPEELGL